MQAGALRLQGPTRADPDVASIAIKPAAVDAGQGVLPGPPSDGTWAYFQTVQKAIAEAKALALNVSVQAIRQFPCTGAVWGQCQPTQSAFVYLSVDWGDGTTATADSSPVPGLEAGGTAQASVASAMPIQVQLTDGGSWSPPDYTLRTYMGTVYQLLEHQYSRGGSYTITFTLTLEDRVRQASTNLNVQVSCTA